jgi:hypothetical protein
MTPTGRPSGTYARSDISTSAAASSSPVRTRSSCPRAGASGGARTMPGMSVVGQPRAAAASSRSWRLPPSSWCRATTLGSARRTTRRRRRSPRRPPPPGRAGTRRWRAPGSPTRPRAGAHHLAPRSRPPNPRDVPPAARTRCSWRGSAPPPRRRSCQRHRHPSSVDVPSLGRSADHGTGRTVTRTSLSRSALARWDDRGPPVGAP